MLGVDAEKVDLDICPSVIVALFWVTLLPSLSLCSQRLLGLKLSFILSGISSKSSRKHVFAFLFVPCDQVLLSDVATKLDCIFLHLVLSKENRTLVIHHISILSNCKFINPISFQDIISQNT